MSLYNMSGMQLSLPVLLLNYRYESALRFASNTSSTISEAHQIHLLALQLQIAYGKFLPGRDVPELKNKLAAARRRREDEWRAVGNLSKRLAMEQYVALVDNLFPNWTEKLEVRDQGVSPIDSPLQTHLSSSTISRLDKGTQSSLLKTTVKSFNRKLAKTIDFPHVRNKASLDDFKKHDYSSVIASLPKLNLNANSDAADTIRRVNKQMRNREFGKSVSPESKYYRTTLRHEAFESGESSDQMRAVLGGFLDTLQSGTGRGPELSLWTDRSKETPGRLSAKLVSFAKATERPSKLTSEQSYSHIESVFRPRFSAVQGVLSEITKLIGDDAEQCGTWIRVIERDFEVAVENLLAYVSNINDIRVHQAAELESLHNVHSLEHDVLANLRDLYTVKKRKNKVFTKGAGERSTLQIKIAEGLSQLPDFCGAEIRLLETNQRTAVELLTELSSKLAYTECERDKIIDELMLMQQSAYSDSIELGNMNKALKRSVGIIQSADGRGIPNEMTLKKELDEARSELIVIRKNNEELHERMRESRRRNSLAPAEDS